MTRPRVLFVGAFAPTGADGTTGGVTFACRTLLASERAREVDWSLVDTTATTNLERSFLQRARPALRRVATVARLVALRRVDRAVIFASHGGSFYEKGLMALIARRGGVRVLFSPRSGFLLDELPARPRMARFARRVFAASATVLCQSAFWRDFYARYTDEPERLAVVQNWIDVGAYPVGSSDERFAVPTVLFMSWVVREKGIHELMEAVAALNADADVPPFELVVCGGGDALGSVTEAARRDGLDNVRFEGWVDGARKAELLRRSHVCVLPSHAEGLSNLLLEAMASGLAVVSTDVGAAPDIIADGRSGLLVPPRASATLAAALARVLGDAALRERLGQAARHKVETENAIDVGVARFFDLLLGEKRGNGTSGGTDPG